MYKKILALTLAGTLMFAAPAAAAPSDWAAAEVTAAQNSGIVPERLQSSYQNPVTREEFCEMAMLLWSSLAGKEMPVATSTFADTQNPSVAAAQSLGIVQGESPTQFSPNNLVTRQEICVMLRNALTAALPELAMPAEYANTFPDGDAIASWAMEAVQCMNLFAVMLGDENGNINPLDNTTREQAILLTYRLKNTQTQSVAEMVEQMFFGGVIGNTHENMLNGGFTVGMPGGVLYYSGANGIWKKGDTTPIVAKPAKNMLAYETGIYYIGEDGAVYLHDNASGTEEKKTDAATDSFFAYGDSLFYRNLNDGGRIYRMVFKTGETSVITPGAAELPIDDGGILFYSDGAGIYKLAKNEEAALVFAGTNSKLGLKDKKFYFLDGAGRICSLPFEGGTPTVISDLAAEEYCFTRDCLIALGRDDGAVYKVDYSGRYTIKMDTGTYVNINTYDDYVYALDAEGGIYTFSNNATEKARIN